MRKFTKRIPAQVRMERVPEGVRVLEGMRVAEGVQVREVALVREAKSKPAAGRGRADRLR